MAMAKDLYAVLGVARDASAEDIKKAYRQLSKEWHPDKHKGEKQAEDRFKEINEAYEILSDPEKKQRYDQFGSTGSGQGGGFNGFDGFDFSSFQGQGVNFGDLFENFFSGGRREAQTGVGEDHEATVTIDLADVVTGKRVPLRLRRFVPCGVCSGAGAKPGTSFVQCGTCGGTGQTVRTVQSFFGQIQQRAVCATCRGSGTMPKEPCDSCKGEGRVQETSEVAVEVPPGIDDGQTLKIRNYGSAGRRGEAAGVLFVHIRVREDSLFEREGADIRSEVSIPAIDAILGGTVEVETVHGPTTLQIPEGTQPGQVLRIRGKGLPVLSSSRTGDHYVSLLIEIPKKLSKAEKKILEEWRKLSE